jgi:membrane fusion protein, multidrug efflux system
LRRAELDLANTEIRAPFDGVLDKRAVEVGDVLESGGAVATVVDLDPLRAVGYATERAVAFLKPGAPGRATVVGGAEAEGRVVYIAATADEATRTYRVELEIPNPGRRLAAGLTTQLRLPAGERPAYLVPPSALSLGDDGSVGVKVVDENRRVRFLPAVIAATETRGAWLTGLPAEITLIVTGHEFVASGAPVEAVEAEGNPS